MAPDAASIVLCLLLAGCLSISLVTDLCSRLIYDVVTGPTFALALLARGLLVGWDGSWGLSSGLVGAGLGLAVFLLPAWLGGMGVGDVKLAATVGALVGWERLPGVLLCIALAGGVLALGVMVRRGVVGATLLNVAALLIPPLRRRRAHGPAIHLPYGVAIAVGTFVALLLPRWLGIGSELGVLP